MTKAEMLADRGRTGLGMVQWLNALGSAVDRMDFEKAPPEAVVPYEWEVAAKTIRSRTLPE